MGLSVVTLARNTRLTTVARVKTVAAIDVSSAEIDEVTAAIVSFCRRGPFAREVYTETLPGYGDVHLQLRRTPIASVSAVTQNSNVVTDYSIAEAGRGWLYRQNGWDWSSQRYAGLGWGGAWLDQGMPVPGSEEPTVSVTYTAGYFLPDDNVSGTGITASSTDNSFNDASSRFPTTLRAGDVIAVEGFTNEANNGRFLVSGTPTAAKIIVDATLVTDSGSDVNRTIRVESLPKDVERAAIETIKSWYAQRADDSSVVEKQMGPARVRYAERPGETLPPLAAALLRPYVRAA